MVDIQQLATLLGRGGAVSIRKTDETPPRLSVIDVAILVTGKDARKTAQDIGYVKERYPEVAQNLGLFKFPGRRQRETPVANIRGAVELVLLLPGHYAARIRHQAASLLVRFLGGDTSLVDEVCRIRGLQQELAVLNPEDPRRVFGEAVEAGSTPVVGEQQLARVCTDIVARLLPRLLESVTAHLDERLATLEARQHVNLNVRAPKRAAVHNHPVVRDIAHAGRPLPVARFLDQKEREDPSWSSARKSFAPSFGMQVQVLKKRKLKADGVQGVYVEQNHRPQLLYTDEDRPLMEEAWALTEAHREDLSGVRQAVTIARPARAASGSNGPSVIDLLRGM
jgi:hypothetical protein